MTQTAKVATNKLAVIPITVFTIFAVVSVVFSALFLAPNAYAHGPGSELYRATIHRVEPPNLPVDIRIHDIDRLRIQNMSDEELLLCGYVTAKCEPYARINDEGVFQNTDSQAYYANLDTVNWGEIPPDAGKGPEQWEKVRTEPAFFDYHDHRIHWMGGKRQIPPGVDPSDPEPQKVSNFTIRFKLGDTDAEIQGQLDYIGGETFWQKWDETIFAVIGISLLTALFLVDSRARKKKAREQNTAKGEVKHAAEQE